MSLPTSSRTFRAIAVATLIAFAASGCAWTFHPERRGNNGGYIATAPLIGDILWFIPGILPGVIFLIVDFTSGAIYVNHPREGVVQQNPPARAHSASASPHRRRSPRRSSARRDVVPRRGVLATDPVT